MAGVVGVLEGEGPWLSPRAVDHAASRPPRSRAWTGGRVCMPGLANLAQGTVCKILDQEEVKPHKVRYYLEQRDPDFAEKLAEVLCVYRQVKILKQTAAPAKKKRPSDAVAIISYDEKPGIQAIATTAPDLPPEPGAHATFAREHEYKRHGTVSLLAGIDLVTGKVHALVKDRHRSREFIEFLELLDAAYPPRTAIRLILDNHSAHVSRETKAWLADQPAHRFESLSLPSTAPGSIRRGLLLETRPLRPAAHPRLLQAGTQGSPHRRHGLFQPRSRRSHLDLQARQGRMI